MLVRFLCGRDEQRRRSLGSNQPPTIPDLYQDPAVLAANQYFSTFLEIHRKHLALRPSITTGKLYPDVSRAYYEAVHTVLTGKVPAAEAASALQVKLGQITGLKAPVTRASAH